MALSIATSNVLFGSTPTITDAGIGETASNISEHDHSLNYTCGSSAAHFAVNYGARSDISYVGVSGHNATLYGNATIQLLDGALLIDSVTLKRDNNVMFTFPSMSFTNLTVRFITNPVTYQMTLSFIAAGQHLSIDSGEQAGYKRLWLNRSLESRTTTNLAAMPVASTQKSKAAKGKLSLPNLTQAYTEDDMQGFLDFSLMQPFFIKEQEDKPQSSYLCFDSKEDTKAHGQTIQLNSFSLSFTAYTGL